MQKHAQHVSEREREGRVLIVTAVSVERDAVVKGLKKRLKDAPISESIFDVIVGGVGPVATAVRTTKALHSGPYRCVVNAGIAGGFTGQAEVGSIVVASEVIAADLGVETLERFYDMHELGFGQNRLEVEPELFSRTVDVLRSTGLTIQTGPILTVSTATGTAATTVEMLKRVPGAVAEAMEGYGAAFAAQTHGVPFLEIRAISNLVGPRDRNSWRIEDALEALSVASSNLAEVFAS